MYSRAHLLIEKDLEELQKDKPWGIEAHPVREDNIFEWTAKIFGVKGSIWEGGVFRLYIKFNENYNYTPPVVCFHTIPFHPNVDMITGKPGINFLDYKEKWDPSFSISFILQEIQNLLCNPMLDKAINMEAVEMLSYYPQTYKQVVQDCVAASQRVEAGLSPYVKLDTGRLQPPKEKSTMKETSRPTKAKIGKLSFEDYYNTWSGIATSKSNVDSKNPLLEAIKQNVALQTIHYGLPLVEIEAQMDDQLQEHGRLKYGKINSNHHQEDENEKKVDKVNQMRKIYLQQRTPGPAPTSEERENGEEPWEKEVDDLVEWTNKLDDETL